MSEHKSHTDQVFSHVEKTSENISKKNLEKLKEAFPQLVKDGEVDFEAFKAVFSDDMAGPEKYGLNWAGKSNAFKAIRIPATGTLIPEKDKSKNWNETENVFIEGDNLEVLKLLQKAYREKIKMIYIDPPYNTGKDFVYKDNFVQGVSDYYEQTGQTKDGIKMTANTEKNGRYHSDWLTMMYPRLFLARNLLKEDGVIFVSIDDNEVANLRMVMDEVFGEENFVENFMWLHGKGKKDALTRTLQQYILCYAKDKSKLTNWFFLASADYDFKDYDNDPRGPWFSGSISFNEEKSNKKHKNYFEITSPSGIIWKRQWQCTKEEMQAYIGDNKISFGPGPEYDSVPRLKIFPNDVSEQIPQNIIDTVGTTRDAQNNLDDILYEKVFNYPKPVSLIKWLAKFVIRETDAIILDFFAGSGTTAHAIMDLNTEDDGNRKSISVQLPEIIDKESEGYKAGYKTIAEITRERIRRAGDKIGKGDIGFKSYKLSNSNYRQWGDITEEGVEKVLKQSRLFIDKPLVDGYDEENVVHEIAIKEGFDLNVQVQKEENSLKTWIIENEKKRLFVTFAEKVNESGVKSLNLTGEDVFVCFDSALDDTDKINLGKKLTIKVI